MPRDSDDQLGLLATEVGTEGLGEDLDLYGAILGVGAQVGTFVVDALHSRGGFGSVYRVHHALTGAPAALKLLHQHMARSESIVSRFLRESATVGRVAHPSVVTLLEHGQLTDGRPYLVMEWIEGKTLEATLLEQGAMPLPRAVGLLEQLCAGLAAAHGAGVVHRDLKASNVMLVDDPAGPRVKLVDFGIAKVLDAADATRLTRTGIRLGTPAYMAPEQIVGGAVTPQTDVYAVGVLLYHMLTGQLPFGGRTAIEVEDHHLHTPPPRASDVTELHSAVDDVILRCLAKDPAMRYASVEELADALRACQEGKLRPSRRFHAAPSRGVALHVGLDAAVPAPAAAALLDRARQLAAEQALTVLLDDERALLGVATVRDDVPGQAGGQVDRLAAAARALLPPPCAVTVHLGPVQTLLIDGMVQIVGGELLASETWAAATPGVTVTPAARDADTPPPDARPPGAPVR